jgi:hypothetical protein
MAGERDWSFLRPIGGRCDAMCENGMRCPLPAQVVTWPERLRFCGAHGERWKHPGGIGGPANILRTERNDGQR